MKKSILFLLFLASLISCKVPVSDMSDSSIRTTRGLSLSHAEGFSIEDFDDYKLLTVFDPWQKSKDIVFQYLLGKDSSLIPTHLKRIPFIKTPVRRAITLSTTHIAYIDTLSGVESISGVSGSSYVYNTELRERIQSGAVRDIGYNQSLNYELIVEMEPDVIFMYGVEGTIGTTIAKLKDLGLKPVLCGDYLETHPLGKAEWLKFFGEFYDRNKEAGIIYNGIDSAYMAVVKKSAETDSKPAILSGLPWKNTWYIPGGKSFAAQLIEDAGGNYLWSENASEEAVPLDLESVYLRAINADIWINPGDVPTMEKLIEFEERFTKLPVFMEGLVFSNSLRMNSFGGNDYWESGALRPDLIIADLFAIFHPEHNRNHHFIYYRKLK